MKQGLVAVVAALVALAFAGSAYASAAPSSDDIDYGHWSVRTVRPIPGAEPNWPTWSRDGSALRFAIAADPRHAGFDTIYATDPLTGKNTRCVTCRIAKGFRNTGQTRSPWAESPDHRWLLAEGLGGFIEALQRTGAPCGVCSSPGALGQLIDSHIGALELDSKGVAVAWHQLTFEEADAAHLRPVFTPDGKHIIWWSNRGIVGNPATEWKHWRIMIGDFDVVNGKPVLRNQHVLIDRAGAVIEDGGISGDGRDYYYLKTVNQDPDLFAIDMATGKERDFQRQVGWDEFPNPAPNGKAVYFMSDRAYDNVVCDPAWKLFGITGQPVETDFLTVIFGTFLCVAGGSRKGKLATDPYVADPSGNSVVRLSNQGQATDAAWSPDSCELAMRAQAANVPIDQIPIFRFRALKSSACASSRGASRCLNPASAPHGKRLGDAVLGRTRRAQRRSLNGKLLSRRGGMDRYCVAGGGFMRIGYPTRRLRRSHPRRGLVRRAGSRALIVLTSSGHASARGIRRGSSTRTLRRRLRGERRYRAGRNLWYLAPSKGVRLVFKTRRGRVLEVGIVDKRLSRGRGATRSLLHAWHL